MCVTKPHNCLYAFYTFPIGNKLCGSKLVQKNCTPCIFISQNKQTGKQKKMYSIRMRSACRHLSETARRFHPQSGPCGGPPWILLYWGCCGASCCPSWHQVSSPDSHLGQTEPLTPPLPYCIPHAGPSVLSTVAFLSTPCACVCCAIGKANKTVPACMLVRLCACFPPRSELWAHYVTVHHTHDHTWSLLPFRGVTYRKACRMQLRNKCTGTDKSLSNHLTFSVLLFFPYTLFSVRLTWLNKSWKTITLWQT